MEDQIKGAARNIAGHVQDAAGGLTGDRKTQAKGIADEIAGGAQYAYGKSIDSAKEAYGEFERFLRDQPLAGIGIGVGIGFLLGQLFNRD